MSSASAADHSLTSQSASAVSTRLRVPDAVRIDYRPLRDGGLRMWSMGLGILGIGVTAAMVADNLAMGAVCVICLLVATWRIWLPITYELGTKGITQSTLVFRWRIPWRCFARYETRPRGVWLLSDADPTPVSTLRGIYVPWSDQESQVVAVLEFFLAPRRQRAANTTRTFAS